MLQHDPIRRAACDISALPTAMSIWNRMGPDPPHLSQQWVSTGSVDVEYNSDIGSPYFIGVSRLVKVIHNQIIITIPIFRIRIMYSIQIYPNYLRLSVPHVTFW